jgi:hypothetical protein
VGTSQKLNGGKLELFAIAVDLETGRIIHDIQVFDAVPQSEWEGQNTHATLTPVVEDGRIYAFASAFRTLTSDGDSVSIRVQSQPLAISASAQLCNSGCIDRVDLSISPICFGRVQVASTDATKRDSRTCVGHIEAIKLIERDSSQLDCARIYV